MGMKFLRRKKDRAVPLLDDESDHGMTSFDGGEVAKLAVLRPATSGDFSAPTIVTEKADNKRSEGTPATAAATPSPTAAAVGKAMEAQAMTGRATPSPAQQSVDARLISPPTTHDDTPLQSNKTEALVKNVATFDKDDDDDTVDTGSRLELLEPLEKSPKRKKGKKKKGVLKFLKPSKKDTAPIARTDVAVVSPEKSPEKSKRDEKVEAKADEKSQFSSNVLVLREVGEEEAFEMELSVAGGDGVGTERFAAGDSVAVARGEAGAGRLERVTEEVVIGGTDDDDAGADDAVQNLSTLFDDAAAAGGLNDTGVTTGAVASAAAAGGGVEQKKDRSFLSRLRGSPSRKSAKAENEGGKGRGPTPAAAAAGKPPKSPGAATPKAKVPEFISDGDDATMPSMLTEPESVRLQRSSNRRTATPSPLETPGADDPVRAKPPGHAGGPAGAGRASPPPLAEAIGRGREEMADLASYLGTATGFTATVASTAVSVAAQAGGIEKLLGAFNCGGDTTVGAAVTSVLRCEPVCGAEVPGKDAVDLEMEAEEERVLKFQSKMIQKGVKLIYHESPSRASTNSDWIQSTVKLFLRPGNCHGSTLQQPTLAWAVLPVVSRTKMPGGIGSFDSAEGKMWSTLGLLDVHSILADDGDGSTTAESKVDDGAGAATAKRTGFFSITATNGAVHVFEAPTPKDRDYVVAGLRGCIARLAYHMVAGNANVIGEMYSEDAGALTGELPSLVSPWKAVGRVTHDFMDRQ